MKQAQRRYDDAIASCDLVTSKLVDINRSLQKRTRPPRNGICREVREQISDALAEHINKINLPA